MSFNFPLLKPVRIILFPISLVYYAAIFIRNRMYDYKILPSQSFALPIISVGNIAVGGTGKSPMVEYLLNNLGMHFNLATLSRGYKRKTRGYVLANSETTALDIGDEPMQFHLKFPEIAIAVGEERILAVPQLLHDRPETQAIILDDAFQHRQILPGYQIVLTDYSNLYTRDWYLPTGDLRDEKASVKRANMVVVTKCPENLRKEEAESIRAELDLLPGQGLFFTTIHYGNLYHIVHHHGFNLQPDAEVLLVTGIANPKPIKKLLNERTKSYEQLVFSDHHIFTIDDLREIERRFHQIPTGNKIIVTTEKDAVRLVKFSVELDSLPVFVLPIEMHFLFGEADKFSALIGTFIKQFLPVANT